MKDDTDTCKTCKHRVGQWCKKNQEPISYWCGNYRFKTGVIDRFFQERAIAREDNNIFKNYTRSEMV